jgi:hypothetical protein
MSLYVMNIQTVQFDMAPLQFFPILWVKPLNIVMWLPFVRLGDCHGSVSFRLSPAPYLWNTH